MSAPSLWIIFPLILAGVLWLLRDERITTIAASIVTFLLALTAWLLRIDIAQHIGGWSFKITPSLEILGRHLTLTPADQPLLILIYGSVFFWFAASAAIQVARHLIPIGMAITALLVASLAVDPFLYAALLLEMAVLLAVPLLSTPNQATGRGVMRFVIFQTLAMPFILFSGWLLAGIEANPGDLALVAQAAILLGLGFTLLLAIFPFHTWIPLLAEEAPPYAVGFVLWMFPTAGLLFLTNVLERYTWLRTAPALPNILAVAGVLMVATGGILAAFQRHLGRMLAYAAIVETGFSLLALSLNNLVGLALFFALFIPRFLNLGIWAFALSILQRQVPSLGFSDVKGLGRTWSFSSTGLILANISLTGLPILAGFPIRLAMFENLAGHSTGIAFWVFLGSLGLAVGAVRTLAVLVMAPEGTKWETRESFPQKAVLIISWALLFLLGLFPQWVTLIMARLPTMFQHLGQ
jgi:NADH-quinone oxidoreductase subunit N